jgi:hypothetical protein
LRYDSNPQGHVEVAAEEEWPQKAQEAQKARPKFFVLLVLFVAISSSPLTPINLDLSQP